MGQFSEAEQILDAIEIVDDILSAGTGIEAGLSEVVEAFLGIFDCDRAFLRFFKPPGFGGLFAPVEYVREPWPATLVDGAFPEDGFTRSVFTMARDGGEVLICGAGGLAIPAESLPRRQGARAMMVMAIQPYVGAGWLMGVHYCRRVPVLNFGPRLMARIGARMAEAVSTHVSLEHLRQSEDRFRALVEHAPEAILIIDIGTQRLIDVNAEAERLFGWPPGQLLGASLDQLQPAVQADGQRSEQVITEALAAVAAGSPRSFEWEYRRADGARVPCEVKLVRLPNPERLLARASISDISDRRAMQRQRDNLSAQLHQARKMEAIGQLTGGLAHDFNNFLAILSSQLELLGMVHARGDEAAFTAELAVAQDACEQAASLIQQLLTFARQRSLSPKRVDLSAEVERNVELLRRTLGAGVELHLDFASEPCEVRIDPTQLLSALINLCVNARDAMPEHCGRLWISSEALELRGDERRAVDGEEMAGRFAVVRIRDEAGGIHPELLARVCEPFFTTKEGTGSGLGLSMVYGFVKQSGGHVEIDSELGRGTEIGLYFPALSPQTG
ncbi:MAG: PAS domain S-box protein [Myxococcales bacterium]|nr:PAS domain S-box protein [Myxococcales bacterium]